MDKNEVKTYPQPYNSLAQFIKDGCRLNQIQLEEELEWAEQKAKEVFPASGRCLPQDKGFQDMLKKMEERGITPQVTSDFGRKSKQLFERGNFWEIRAMFDAESENSFEEGKIFLKEEVNPDRTQKKNEHKRKEKKAEKRKILPLFRTAGTVAACFAAAVAVFLLKPGMDVVGRRDYQYHRRIRNENKGDIVWNNQEDYLTELGHLEKAYQKIKDELGIAVLKLNYIPEDIILSKVTIEERHARLEFVKQDSFLYVLEVIYPVDDSANRFSDRTEYKKIYNEWMDKWIFIQKNQLEEDLVEYNAYFEHENAYYYLQGIVEENEFICILEDLTLEVD